MGQLCHGYATGEVALASRTRYKAFSYRVRTCAFVERELFAPNEYFNFALPKPDAEK
jgi:hypothetical protein